MSRQKDTDNGIVALQHILYALIESGYPLSDPHVITLSKILDAWIVAAQAFYVHSAPLERLPRT